MRLRPLRAQECELRTSIRRHEWYDPQHSCCIIMWRGFAMIRAVAVIVLYGVSLLSYANPPVNRPGGPPWPSGVSQIMTPDGLNAWQQWMGYEADVVVAMSNPATTWADFRTGHADTGAYFKAALKYLPKTTTIIHAYPMLPNEVSNKDCRNPGVWDQFAAGQFDSHYREMARNMRSLIQNSGRDPSTVIIRLGWEMNGYWYAWSICDKVPQFKQSWERAVRIIREEMPGMQFDFSAGRPYAGFTAGLNYGGGAGVNLAGLLPADDSYDFISRSTHDARPFTTSDATFEESTLSPPPSSRTIGLLELRDTAAARGKKFALSEWGAQMVDCSSNWPKSPNPAMFLSKVYDFLLANANHLAWDTYFSPSCTQLYGRQTTDAAKTYKSLWGNSQPAGNGGNNDAVPNAPQQFIVE